MSLEAISWNIKPILSHQFIRNRLRFWTVALTCVIRRSFFNVAQYFCKLTFKIECKCFCLQPCWFEMTVKYQC